MHDQYSPEDSGSLWRDQPSEKATVLPSLFLNRRTRALSASTRSEIITSLGAGTFFVAVLAWRFELRTEPYVIAGAGLVLCWMLVTSYRFRKRIWPEHHVEIAALSSPAVEFYRAELGRRREHLMSLWIWTGPLLLACVTLALILFRTGVASKQRLYSILPLLLLLGVWTGVGVWRRRRLAADIQREIDEIAGSQA